MKIIVALLAAALTLTACSSADDEPTAAKPPETTATATAPESTATPAAAGTDAPSSPPKAAKKIRVPSVVGKNHQEAQNLMQDAGLFMLAEEDATGQGRLLILDRNWQVVRQSPKAGTRVSPETKITLYSKKIGE